MGEENAELDQGTGDWVDGCGDVSVDLGEIGEVRISDEELDANPISGCDGRRQSFRHY